MKYFLIMIMAVMVSVSCSDDDDDDGGLESDLVGTWEMTEVDGDEEYRLRITFNKNLTGTAVLNYTFDGETDTETESFEWKAEGNKLTLIYEDQTVTNTYSISGDKLTVTELDGTINVLTRA